MCDCLSIILLLGQADRIFRGVCLMVKFVHLVGKNGVLEKSMSWWCIFIGGLIAVFDRIENWKMIHHSHQEARSMMIMTNHHRNSFRRQICGMKNVMHHSEIVFLCRPNERCHAYRLLSYTFCDIHYKFVFAVFTGKMMTMRFISCLKWLVEKCESSIFVASDLWIRCSYQNVAYSKNVVFIYRF